MARQSRPLSILITRPRLQAESLALQLRSRFAQRLQIMLSPLMETAFMMPDLPDLPFHTLIFTSRTGVESYAQNTAHPALVQVRSAFCVGDQTAQAARKAGLAAHSAAGDVDAMIAAIVAARPAPPLLHLRGKDVAGSVEKSLNRAGLETFSAVTYAQNELPLTAAAAAVLTNSAPVLVPLFSPRSAKIFAAEYARVGGNAPLLPVAISATAAAALGMRCEIAAQPNAAAMLDAIARVLDCSGTA